MRSRESLQVIAPPNEVGIALVLGGWPVMGEGDRRFSAQAKAMTPMLTTDGVGESRLAEARAFMGSNRTQKPICFLAEPLVSDRVAVQHKNVLRTCSRSCGEQSSRSTAQEARRLRSADRTRRRISTPAGPPQREFCLGLAFSPAGETLSSRLWRWRRLCV